MKTGRILSFGFAFAFVSAAIASCTLDFDQFQAGGGGTGGNCGECCVPADCTAPTDPCKQATCDAGVCGEQTAPDGTALATQVEGDCKKVVCQSGAPATINDDTDANDDGNDCTVDSCLDGTPIDDFAASGAQCSSNGGNVCDGAGTCVECITTADCPNGETCNEPANDCVPGSCMDGQQNGSETDEDCGGPQCSPCDVGQGCEAGSDCTSGVCGQNGNCSAPTCNDNVENGDETDVDCGAACPNQCGPTQGCDADNDCTGGDCSGPGGTCVPNCTDEVKNGNETDVDCGGDTCGGCDLGQDCAGVDANCLSGNCGAGDKCEKAPDGTTCGNGSECQSGNCVNGFCCDTACGATCMSCAVPGSEGTCTNVPSGQDIDNDCPGPDLCDGMGVCKKLPGGACVTSSQCLMGMCADSVCCNTACGGVCEACDLAGSEGTCTKVPNGQDPDNECTGVCNGNGACVLGSAGAACAAGNECTSGFCADGVCCDTACDGTCVSCKLAGTVGTCTNIPNGQDPDNECPGMKTCTGMAACN
ncbi:MAG: hypothetical protein R3F14_22240 [Polyangiaceae bacterium]